MNYSDFTPEFKDSILKEPCESVIPYSVVQFNWKALCPDFNLLNTCLTQFKNMRLVGELNLRRNVLSGTISITADALDFFNSGGFTFREERLMKELEKVNLELEKLKAKPGLKKYVEQISGVTGIISDLILAVGAIRG